MFLPKYPITTDVTFQSYQFISVGPKGNIIKGIEFKEVPGWPSVYNLALGDIDLTTGEIDDSVITDNKDSELVFATVGAAVTDFCNHFPNAPIVAEGNTPAKKRLYQITISTHLTVVSKNFLVFGLLGGQWEHFRKNKTYQAILVKRIND